MPKVKTAIGIFAMKNKDELNFNSSLFPLVPLVL
jgi:hypothetical protein